jgi:hypothetical protein
MPASLALEAVSVIKQQALSSFTYSVAVIFFGYFQIVQHSNFIKNII